MELTIGLVKHRALYNIAVVTEAIIEIGTRNGNQAESGGSK